MFITIFSFKYLELSNALVNALIYEVALIVGVCIVFK